ncbi:MAG: hypothetical protein EOM88_04260 [Clostridia bacterium]|nr:hypothetical protein [Clostridia bacterium]
MEINKIKKNPIEKKSGIPEELIVEGQDHEDKVVVKETLKRLGAYILDEYLKIINNPETTKREKVKIFYSMILGKNYLYKAMTLLSLVAPLQAEGKVNFPLDFDQLKKEINMSESKQETFESEMEKYKEFSSLMAYNLASENPTSYQVAEIKKLEDGIINDLNGRQFPSMAEMIIYINNSISSDFSDQESTIYIKDAFPEEAGVEAKGSFDCDSRLLICLSILSKIGITSNQVEFCMLEGHALLRINEDDVFFEMTSNSTRELNEDEYLQLNRINSLDKYKAYLLSKEGTALASEATKNIFSGERDDEKKIAVALNKMITAAEIDPNNLNNNLNLLTVLKKIYNRTSYEKPLLNELVIKISGNIQRFLLNNYYEINTDGEMDKTFVLQVQEINSQKIQPRRLEDLGTISDLTTRALKENAYLSKKFTNLAIDLLYDLQNPEAALPIFEELANSEIDKKKNNESSNYCFYKGMLADCHFRLNEYKEYLDIVNNELYRSSLNKMQDDYYFKTKYYEENLKINAASVMTGRIIINEKTVDGFCKKYKGDPLFSGFISGKQHWNASAIDAVESLRSWSGFKDMMRILDDYRGNKNKDANAVSQLKQSN